MSTDEDSARRLEADAQSSFGAEGARLLLHRATAAPGGASASEAPISVLPAALASRYKLLAVLPAGGEADMWRVADADGTELVLKLYRPGIIPDRETWNALRKVDSQFIVRMLEAGEADGRAYEVMEYLPGGTLLDWMEEERLPTETITEVVRQIAAGLKALHNQQIIHRDLKPANVMVHSRSPLQLALADFGLSRYLPEDVAFSRSGHTLTYTAPETFAGHVSPSRDWWSLGMIVRELATGEPPFRGMPDERVMLDLATRPFYSTNVLDERLRQLCMGLLVRDPNLRWGADEVDRWLAGGSPPVIGFNPFVVPGLEYDPDQPLCPWRDGFHFHEDYYAEVGGQHEAFELFKQTLRHPGQLARASRIVVVTGPEYSGKTSLANRCVNWVVAGLDPTTTQCHIYPLREVCPRHETVRDRVAKVCRRLVEKLRELNPGSGEGLAGNLLGVDEVLPLFGRFHQSSRKLTRYFIILLPRLEPDTAETEIDEYRAALAGVPGILCVTEGSPDVPLPIYRGDAPPISLRLRYLHSRESRTVVAGWPGTPQPGDGLPIIREKDLDELDDLLRAMNAGLPLGKLLAALRKVYDNAPGMSDTRAGGVSYVEYSELVKAYLGKWVRLTQ